MIEKLPRWAWLGGAVLAGIAGMVNSVGFLCFTHQAVTHLTGTTTLLAIALARLAPGEMLHLALVLGAFVAGATFSGFVIEHSTLRLGRRYGVVMVVEAALLASAAALMASHAAAGGYFASAACGLQNAMAGSYSGSVLRTTHLTGMFTDFGVALGHWLRGVPADWKRLRLCLNLIASFAAGGVAGTLLFQRFGPQSLYIPAAIAGVVGLAYSAYAHFQLARTPRQPPAARPR